MIFMSITSTTRCSGALQRKSNAAVTFRDAQSDGSFVIVQSHAAIIEGGEMIIRYTCDGKAIGQTMFHYTPETYVDWFRSMMNEMDHGTGGSTKKNKVKVREKRPPARASRSR